MLGVLAPCATQVAGCGAPSSPAGVALLGQLACRLRLKLGLAALAAAVEAAAELAALMRTRGGAGGPLVAAAWRCWRCAARGRAARRARVATAAVRR